MLIPESYKTKTHDEKIFANRAIYQTQIREEVAIPHTLFCKFSGKPSRTTRRWTKNLLDTNAIVVTKNQIFTSVDGKSRCYKLGDCPLVTYENPAASTKAASSKRSYKSFYDNCCDTSDKTKTYIRTVRPLIAKNLRYLSVPDCYKNDHPLLKRIAVGEHFLAYRKNQRFYNTYTYLPKIHRAKVLFHDEPIVQLDCRAMLLSCLANLAGDESLKRDLAKAAGFNGMSIWQALEQHLRDVNYQPKSKDEPDPKRVAYQVNTPRTHMAGNHLVKFLSGYKKFYKYMTEDRPYGGKDFHFAHIKMEHDIMLSLVKQLAAINVPCLTVHDCFCVKESDSQKAHDYLQMVCGPMGIYIKNETSFEDF
jgi:hypothetical protein